MARESGGVSFRMILSGVAFFVILGFLLLSHANFVLGRAMVIAFPPEMGWDVTYRSAWPRLLGGVVAKDVTFTSPIEGDDTTYHFDRVRVEVPFWQYYRSGFSRARAAPLRFIKDFRLVFEGGKGEMSWPFSHELHAFGNASASPFEAEGCAQDGLWSSDEVRDMGLAVQPSELVMAYHRTSGGLIKEQSLHVPGVGSVEFRREMNVSAPLPLFLILYANEASVTSDEWHVKDEGFVAARNAFCAKKDGIDTAQFVERHVATVKRMLQTVGLAASANTEAAYRRYASGGGTLDLSVRYDPPIGGELYGSDDLGSWVPRLHGEFAVGGEKLALGLQSTPVRPLPEEDDEGQHSASVFALMQREGSAPASVAAQVAPSAQVAAAAIATPTPAAPAAAVPPVATIAAAAPATMAPSAPLVPSSTALASAMPATVASAASIPAAPRAAPVEAPVTGTGSGKLNLASAARVTDSVASVNAPPPLSESTAAVDQAASTLDYAQLGAAVGQRVTVYLKNKEPMLAEVVGVEKGIVHIRRHLRSGWVEYAVDRAGFDYAERRN